MTTESITLNYDQVQSLIAFCNNINPNDLDAWHSFEPHNTLRIDTGSCQDPATGRTGVRFIIEGG